MANNIATTFTPLIWSWKMNTAITGTMGKPKVHMTLENSEETLKISPTTPMLGTCHVPAVHVKFNTYYTFPSSYSFISLLKFFHSLLAKSPTRITHVTMRDCNSAYEPNRVLPFRGFIGVSKVIILENKECGGNGEED
ncbi:unnamed protein product [Ilex paraguariensis]|uniref:Uncharacterized protein n=1 Tax=Ilex paraguariensis TaxID=185542 RepID=A0ABC8RWD3_9AQUA